MMTGPCMHNTIPQIQWHWHNRTALIEPTSSANDFSNLNLLLVVVYVVFVWALAQISQRSNESQLNVLNHVILRLLEIGFRVECSV